MRRCGTKHPRAAPVAVAVVGLVALVAWLSAVDLPAQVGDAKQAGGAMQHQDLFRGANPETGPPDDIRLKPEIRYAPIGNNAIIEGDIVVGKVDEIRQRRFYALIEEAREIGHVDDLGLP